MKFDCSAFDFQFEAPRFSDLYHQYVQRPPLLSPIYLRPKNLMAKRYRRKILTK